MTLLFSFPGNEHLANLIPCEKGRAFFHHYPDGETLVRIESDVSGRDVVALCSLDRPDDKVMALMFFAHTARELGAKSVRLIAPYLGYMRQDKRFHDGEAITSNIFANFLSGLFDGLVTIDPHLHRHKTMSEFYKTYAMAMHASDLVSAWIKGNVKNPLLIGPDTESSQWVIQTAKQYNWPHLILNKTREGDEDVRVDTPDFYTYHDHTPVLVDDIISTGHTMMETIKGIQSAGLVAPICIGIHAVFAGASYNDLKKSGAAQIVTTNTIQHETNAIDISSLLTAGHLSLLQELA